ncbi:MAG: branched-chain amino acid transaminase [Candidatus Lustribacter sp.]|jgi:branched-chain amino acid aminotransferase
MDAGLTVYAKGRFSRYDEAKIGLMTHALHYGTGCFEGVRGFWSARDEELYLFQLEEHYERLHASAKILMMKVPHTVAELVEITTELCARNNFRGDVYVRPLMYKSNEEIGVRLHDVHDELAIMAMPFDRYFDATAGLNCTVSGWRRIDDTTAPARAKVTGVYINSALAKSEAVLDGYDEAILLSADGHVSEGSAENIFIVKKGVIYTPDASQNILEGCTRKTLMTLAVEQFGIPVVERAIDRSELFTAEEVFISGSAAGLQFVRAIDHRVVGDGTQGPVATKLAAFYDRVVRGMEPAYHRWLTRTYASRKTATV